MPVRPYAQINSDKLFVEVVDRCPLAILVVDEDTHAISYANQSSAKLFDSTVSELLGSAVENHLLNTDKLFQAFSETDEIPSENSIKMTLLSQPQRDMFVQGHQQFHDDHKVIVLRLFESDKDLHYAQLVRDKELLSTILRDQSELIVRWKSDGIRTFVNDAYCKTFGITREEALGTSFFSLIKEEYIAETKARLGALSPENPISSKAHKVLLPNGKTGWQHWKDRAFFDNEGNVIEYQSVGRDVSDLLEVKKQLSKREEFLDAIMKNVPAIFLSVKNKKGYPIEFSNAFARELLGGDPEQILNKEMFSLFLKDEKFQNFKKLIETEQPPPERGVQLRLHSDFVGPQVKNVLVNWRFAREQNKNNGALCIVIFDLTERLEILERIKQKETELSLIYNNTTDYMALVELSRGFPNLVSINQRMIDKALKFNPNFQVEDIIGHHIARFMQVVLQDDSERIAWRMERVNDMLDQKSPYAFEEVLFEKTEPEMLRSTLVPIYHNDECTHFLWVGTNVTEYHEAAEALKTSLEKINELNEQLNSENIYLKEEVKGSHNFEEIVTSNEHFTQILEQVEQVAPTNSTVLVTGETGTGKELVVRAIHALSQRKDKVLVKVNCASFPADLIESELFGHEQGAFTGAIKRKIGRFELAHNGTLFLDEVGELPMAQQAKLLRAIQEGEFERVGGETTIKSNVRIIAATNKNLEEQIENGEFRADLFYRLSVFPIHLPPLRDRLEDIPILVRHFVNKYSRAMDKKISKIPKLAVERLQKYDWPGNIRELENFIERTVILSKTEVLDVKTDEPSELEELNILAVDQTLAKVEKEHIQKVLKRTNGVIAGPDGAAKLLGLKPSTLRDRMKKHGIL